MNLIEIFKQFFQTLSDREISTNKKMKRVFQLRRYLQWVELTPDEKIGAKRIILTPIFAYFIFTLIQQNIFTIIFIIILYTSYRKLQKGRLKK